MIHPIVDPTVAIRERNNTSQKLSTRTEAESTLFRAIRIGVMGIHDRVNPQRIQRSMNALLPPSMQKE